MKDDFDERLRRLQTTFSPLDESNVENFLRELEELTRNGDRRCVEPVLSIVDDELPLSGVTSQILLTLESVPIEVYVEELLGALPAFATKNPFSAENEIKKILWSEQDRGVLVAAARSAPATQRDSLRNLLGKIETPSLQEAILEVGAALDSPS